MKATTLRLALAAGLVAAPAALAQSPAGPTITVRAVDFVASSPGVSRSGDHVVTPPGDSWIAFDAEIPVAGRYLVEVSGSATPDAGATVNVEDYIHNEDGRYYDVTAGMPLPAVPVPPVP